MTTLAGQPVPGTLRKTVWKRLRTSRTAWAYIAPAGLIMALISFLPQFFQVWKSFTNFRIQNLRFNLFNPETFSKFAPDYVGIENYVRIIKSTLALENYNF